MTGDFSCFTTQPLPFHEEKKNSPKLTNSQSINVIKVLGYSNTCVHKFQKRKKKVPIFYTCIPDILSTYHTGSAFTQHYNVCRV